MRKSDVHAISKLSCTMEILKKQFSKPSLLPADYCAQESKFTAQLTVKHEEHYDPRTKSQ